MAVVSELGSPWSAVLGRMFDVEQLTTDNWRRLRKTRLRALRESPDAFLATFEQERRYDQERWQQEFSRGSWYVGRLGRTVVALVGVTREPGAPADERYLEYLWVSPEQRGSGIGTEMLAWVLKRLRTAAIKIAYLWVLDGNDAAMRLYRRAGFVSANHRQPLDADPSRCEERLLLYLDPPAT